MQALKATLRCCAEMWAEANPLEKTEVQRILQEASSLRKRRVALGLDTQQLTGLSAAQKGRAGQIVKAGEVVGTGRGYFKLSRGNDGDAIDASGARGMAYMATPQALLHLAIPKSQHLPGMQLHVKSEKKCLLLSLQRRSHEGYRAL